jgi:AcrR family transcriptional regulator
MAHFRGMINPVEQKKSGRRVSRQREAGEVTRRETRRKLLAAAAEVFAENGYAAATVAKIADRADVSIQSLYSSWGSKRALLRGVMEAALFGEDEAPEALDKLPLALLRAVGQEEASDPERLIAGLTHQFRLLTERASTAWQTYRDAAAVDPDIAADWQQLQQQRRAGITMVVSKIPGDRLRPGLTKAAAADTAWTIASPDTHELLVIRAGYTLDEFEKWVRTTLSAALLRPTS